MKVLALIFTLLLANAATAGDNYKPLNMRVDLDDSTLSIVSYNVENLFDTKHDEGKGDWEFLPLKLPNGAPNKAKIDACNRMSQDWQRKQCLEVDWTNERLQIKLAKITEALNLQGDLPDVLALIEVENANVLAMLAEKLGYSTKNMHISTGSDARGINVAILYKDRLVEYKSHAEEKVVDESGRAFTTRNILVVNFKVKGTDQIVGVYVNHWPSQGNDVKNRIAAANTLNKLIDAQTKTIGQNYNVVAVGDFNTIQYDRPNPIIETIEGRENGLRDALILLKKTDENTFYQLPTGTSYYSYGGTWDYLDKILVSQSLLEKNKDLKVISNSFRILGFSELSKPFEAKNPMRFSFGSTQERVPNRYNFSANSPNQTGVSDHYPVRILLDIRTN